MFTRATSVYQIDFPGAAPQLLGAILSRIPSTPDLKIELAGSGVSKGGVFIRVRVADDLVAGTVAHHVADGLEFSVRTGYGVHQRQVL